jgi:hypothetical protein
MKRGDPYAKRNLKRQPSLATGQVSEPLKQNSRHIVYLEIKRAQ